MLIDSKELKEDLHFVLFGFLFFVRLHFVKIEIKSFLNTNKMLIFIK
jgi:hypothetical protein